MILAAKKLSMSRSDPYGSYSGYGGSGGGGHSSYGSHSSGYGSDCCPPVVDPLTWLALLGFIAAATYLLNEVIAMSMLMMARKRRKRNFEGDWPEVVRKGRVQNSLNECQSGFRIKKLSTMRLNHLKNIY